jgi:uncharacterized repeat protein (TIGR01451 family)
VPALFAPLVLLLVASGCEAPEREYEAETGDQSPMVARQQTDVEMESEERAFGPVALNVETPEQARVGQQMSYTVTVTNNSDQPVDQVVVSMIQEGRQQQAQKQGRQQQQGRQAQQQQADQQQQARQQGQQQEDPQQAEQQQAQRQQQQEQAEQQQARQQQGQQQARQQQQGRQAQPQAKQQQMKSWNIGRLAPDESRQFSVPFVPQQSGELQACFTVDYRPAVCTSVEVGQPELTLARDFIDADDQTVEQAYACEEIRLRYVLRNTGDIATEEVTIYEELPQGLMTEDGENVIEIEAGSIEPGDEVTETVALQAEQGLQFTGVAIARTEAMQAHSQESQFRILKPQVELQFDGPQRSYVGETVNYRLTVRNTSDVPALETRVNLDLPVDLEDVSLGTQQAEMEDGALMIGRLEGGESRNIELRFRVREKGEINAQATLQAYCVDEQAKQVASMVQGVPALRLEMIDLTDPVNVGDTTTYRIEVKNQGSAEDTNIQLTAELPQGMQYVEADGETEVTAEGQMLRFEPIESLEPGDTVAWEVQVRAEQSGNVRMRLNLESEFLTTAVVESESTTLLGG